jgi:aldose 1-epimerase
MFYHIETEERTAGGRTGTVYTLKHVSGAEAEVWPAHGFNCLRWRVNTDSGPHDLLYRAADWNENPVPTRSGVPILYPFPNRIRDGKFRFEGKNYQLPLNDSAKANAIHGFAPRHAWSVAGYNADGDSAWIHGDLHAAAAVPEAARLWPSDSILSVVCRLSEKALRLEMRVKNIGDGALPFGLGLHPYLRFPCADQGIDRFKLHAPARSIWKSIDNLPTGERRPIPDELNWNSPKGLAGIQLDTPYSNLGAIAERADGMLQRACIGHAGLSGALQIWTTGGFRESVLFTPAHRQAVCFEPYTCATDAVHLEERGIDAGWMVLQPQEVWTGAVEFRWDPDGDV